MPLTDAERRKLLGIASSEPPPTLLTADERRKLERISVGEVPDQGGAPGARMGVSTPATVPQTRPPITSLDYWSRLAKNVPGSASRIASSAKEFVSDPGKGFEDLLTVVPELATIGFGDVMAGLDTPEARGAKSLATEATRIIHSPAKTMMEEPVGGLLDILGLVAPAAKAIKAKSITALAREFKGVSPALRATKQAGAGTFKTAGQVIRGAGKAGEVDYATAIKPALKGERSLVGTAKKVEEAIQEGENLRNLRFQDASARLALKDPAIPIHPESVLGETFDVISKFDHGIKGIADPETGRIVLDFSRSTFQMVPEQAKRIQGLVDVVSDWAGRGDLSIEEAHRVERVIDTLIEKGINKKAFGESNAVLTRARQAIRKELGAKVEGFDEMQRAYREASSLLDSARKMFAIKKGENILEDIGILTREVPVVNETTLNKLAGVFSDKVVGARVRQDTLRELDRILATRTGQPGALFEELAGIHLQQTAPTGISGKVGAAGGVAGLGAGVYSGGLMGGLAGAATGAAAGAIGNLLTNMTIRNPRAVGRFFHSLGATERVAIDVQKLVERVAKATNAKQIAGGITFGAALKRMEERGKNRLQTEKLMKDLGIIQDANYEEF